MTKPIYFLVIFFLTCLLYSCDPEVNVIFDNQSDEAIDLKITSYMGEDSFRIESGEMEYLYSDIGNCDLSESNFPLSYLELRSSNDVLIVTSEDLIYKLFEEDGCTYRFPYR